MAKRIWTFNLENEKHEVTLEHGYLSGKRKIFIDSRELDLPPSEAKQYPDFGSVHIFELSGHECAVVIQTNGVTFTYEFVIDGKALSTGQPFKLEAGTRTEIESSARRVALIIVFLTLAAFSFWWNWRAALQEGYFLPFLAILSPGLLVLAIYYMIFSEDVNPKPIPARLWFTIVLGISIGILHYWLLDSGYFYLLFDFFK